MLQIAAEVDGIVRRQAPEGRRPPFGWSIFGVADEGVALQWGGGAVAGPARLRLTYGLDCRESMRVEATTTSGRRLGAFDLRFAFVHQPVDLRVSTDDVAAAIREGVRLRLVAGEGPAWFFGGEDAPAPVAPQWIMDPSEPPDAASRLAAFRAWFRSPASLQQFGWRLGCVLDGLRDLGEPALVSHVAMFFNAEDRLVYEDPRSQPVVDVPYGVEATLPLAHIARLRPAHPCLDRCIEFWLRARHEDGNVGGTFVSAEGSYTVAYPMAVLGVQRGRGDLIDLAVRQLIIRRDRLRDGQDIWLRHQGDRTRTFRNWCRGGAWYLLGLVRTLVELHGIDRPGVDELRDELRIAATVLAERRHASGLWSNFIDDPAVAIDTSGSAGIAAAMAIGARHGLLGAAFRQVGEDALHALVGYVESDGVLVGAAQDNKGGEELQRGDYRVIHPAGAGLFAQLMAALDASHGLA